MGDYYHDHAAPEKHDHVVLHLEGGARDLQRCPPLWRDGSFAHTATAEQHPLLAEIGPEPLGNAFNEAYLAATLQNRNTPIKSALLDQHLVAGLGNIYVCETLYRARIAPDTRAGSIERRPPCADHPRGAGRGDRSRRLQS